MRHCPQRMCIGDGFIPLIQVFPINSEPFLPKNMTLSKLYEFMSAGANVKIFSTYCECYKDKVLEKFLIAYGKKLIKSAQPSPSVYTNSYISYYKDLYPGNSAQVVIPLDMLRANYAHDIHMAVNAWRFGKRQYHYERKD